MRRLKDNTEKTGDCGPEAVQRTSTSWWAGKGAKAVADAAAKITGVRKVLLAEKRRAGRGAWPESMEALVVPLMANYDAGADPGHQPGPRTSARGSPPSWTVAQISEIVEVIRRPTPFVRPHLRRQRFWRRVTSSDAKKVITVRPTVFKGRGGRRPRPRVETIAAPGKPAKTHFRRPESLVKSERSGSCRAAKDRGLRRSRHGLGRGIP